MKKLLVAIGFLLCAGAGVARAGSSWSTTGFAASGNNTITGVTAGAGLSGGGTSGSVTLTLDVGSINTWTAAQTFSSATVTTLNSSTMAVANTATFSGAVTIGANDSGLDLTVGGGAGDSNPVINIDKSNAGAGQVAFLDQGTQRAQITLDSSEALIMGTDSNQNVQIRVNSATKAIFDTSGGLNLGGTVTNGGGTLLNISTTTAMFSVDGSTATGVNALAAIATTTPCGSNSVVGVQFYIRNPNGTSGVPYYLLACPK